MSEKMIRPQMYESDSPRLARVRVMLSGIWEADGRTDRPNQEDAIRYLLDCYDGKEARGEQAT